MLALIRFFALPYRYCTCYGFRESSRPLLFKNGRLVTITSTILPNANPSASILLRISSSVWLSDSIPLHARTVYQPDWSYAIVLGGPLAVLYPRVSERVESLLAENLVHGFEVPPISVARFGGDGAAIGAAALLRESLFDLPELPAV